MSLNSAYTQFIGPIINGNIASLSRAITLVESSKESHRIASSLLIDALLPQTGNAIRIGITGVPGVGKSTFIESFGLHLIQLGYKVAVLAIDPSSSLSKGSILGDKTRMEQLSVHPNAYIRPTASGGSLGGITYWTHEAALLCEAAGFDIIIIETVGVGQSETEVSSISDYMLLLMLAGAGDELQGIKRGIMEMADGLAITKADGSNMQKAKQARAEYARALHFLPPSPSGCIPEVNICSSYDNLGIDNVWRSIEKYILNTKLSGYFVQKRQQQKLTSFQKLLQEQLQRHFLKNAETVTAVSKLEQKVIQNELSPYTALRQLFEDL